MAAATINTAAWGNIATSPQRKVRTHSLARPRGPFFAAELTLLTVAVLQTAWGGCSPGMLIGITSCALFYHINSLDRSIVSSTSSQFWIALLESVFWGVLASAILFYVFPGLVPRVDLQLTWGCLLYTSPSPRD